MSDLQDHERARQNEKRRASRFIERHGIGSLPGRRSETGESAGRQSVGHHGDPTRPSRALEDGGVARTHRDVLSYDALPGGLAAYEDRMADERGGNDTFNPLVSPYIGAPPNQDELEKRARMNHVFSFMREDQVDLLYWKHVEGMTLQAIADQEGVSRQAIHKRLRRAEAAFAQVHEDHWNDAVLYAVA